MKALHLTLLVVLTLSGNLNGQTITTIAGNGHFYYTGDGPATATPIGFVNGIAFDKSNNLYFGDNLGNKIRKVTPAGYISTFAGNGSGIYSGDGGAATNAGIVVSGLEFDKVGNLFVGDSFRLRKISPTGIITLVAGNGTATYAGDGVPATATGFDLNGFAIDTIGNIFIADFSNQRVRKIDTFGRITTYAGGGTVYGNGGPATAAYLNRVYGVSIDNYQNLYVVCNSGAVRKIAPSGIISAYIGDTTATGGSGDGGPATSAHPSLYGGVKFDGHNNGYISDWYFNRVRIIDATTGIINTFAGDRRGRPGFSGDGGAATAALLNFNEDLAFDSQGNLFISDADNARIRMVSNNQILYDSIVGPSNICLGGSNQYKAQPVNYGIWTSSNTHIVSVDSNGIAHGESIAVDTLTFNASYYFQTSVAKKVVTVIPWPDAGTITGSSTLCPGQQATLSESLSGGVWGSSSGLDSINGATIIARRPGIDTVTYTALTVCGPSVAKHVINISPFPDTGMVIAPTHLCVGETITLNETVTGGIWILTDSNATLTRGVLTGVSAGAATVSYVVSNSCGPYAATKHIVIDSPVTPFTTIRVTHDTTRYPGEIIAFDAEPTYGGSAPTYQWYLNDVPVPGATTNAWGYATYYQETVYCVVTSNLPCVTRTVDTSNRVTIYPVQLGIDGVNHPIAYFNVVPNPAKDIVKITYTCAGTDATRVRIMDLAGNTLIEKTDNINKAATMNLDIHELASGMYLVQIVNGENKTVQKLLKQ